MSRPVIAPIEDLSAAEEAMLLAAGRGEKSDAEGQEIRGIVLRALVNGSRPDWRVVESGVRLTNAVITGGLDFEGCSVAYPLILSRVRIMAGSRGAFVIRDARVKRVSLQDCQLQGSFVADRCQLENGLLLAGGAIEGPFTARGAQVDGAIAFEGTRLGDGRDSLKANGLRLSGPLILRRAKLKGDVQLVRSQLGAGVYAEEAVVEGRNCGFDAESARIYGDFLATGAQISNGLRLANVRLRGRFDGKGLTVSGKETAIAAASVNIGQGLNLVDARIKGEIAVDGAEIGKGFTAEGIEVEGSSTAISAGGISVAGNWDMARAKLVGALNFPGADVRGQLRMTEARIFGAELAIRGDGAQIRGGCYMSRSIVFGLMRFPACRIGNQFRLRGASLKVDSGAALMVNGSHFGRDVELNDGLQSVGALVLDQVQIPGVLDFTGSRIKSAALAREGRPSPVHGDKWDGRADWDEAAISLADCDVKRLCMPVTREDRPCGIVDFSRARVASYQDYGDAWPPGPDVRGRAADGRDIDHLVIDGFTYEHLNNPSGTRNGRAHHRRLDDRVGDQRLIWLEGQEACDIFDHFKPQPWVQLETRLLQQGYSEDARQISIARRRRERNSHATRTLQRWQGGFLDTFALYGFNPWRTVAWIVAFVVLFAGLWAAAGGQCQDAGCRDESVFVMTNRDAYSQGEMFENVYPAFNPLAYSFDVFVPFVSFGYADHWRPNVSWHPLVEVPQPITFAPVEDKPGENGNSKLSAMPTFDITLGGILYAAVIFETILGIVLTSLLITGFTGLLRGD
jgi:hypothetical protein